MRPSTIRYFLKEGFSGLKKNLLMTVASIIAVAACISIMSFSYCVVSNLQYMLDQMEDSIGISVFLKGDLTSEDIENMKTTISGLDHVTNVTYISPADALDQLKDQWGADEDIFIGLDDTLCLTLSRWNWIRSNLRMPYWLNCRKSKALIKWNTDSPCLKCS